MHGFREVRFTRVSGVGGLERAGDWRIRGLACRTEIAYEVEDEFGSFTEIVRRGAFRRTLAEDPVVSLLVAHGGLPLASTRSGTLRLSETDDGLEIDAALDARNPLAQEVMSGIGRGDVAEMSFGFRVHDGGQSWDADYTERDLTELNIHRGDVSIVDMGANPHTEVSSLVPSDAKATLLKQQQQEEEAAASVE